MLEAVPIVTVVEKEGRTVTAVTDVAITGTTHVGFGTSTFAAPLTPTNARPATSPSANASVTHSLSRHHDDLTLWQALVDHIKSLSMTSSLLSMQPLPELRVKKPLRFREPKKERRERVKRRPLWRYALDGEETGEDRRPAEVEELTLLEHHTPITRCTRCDFLTNSGLTSCHDSSPSMSGTMV